MITTRTRRGFAAALTLTISVAMLAACGDNGDESNSGNTLKIGLISGTGPSTPGADVQILPAMHAAIEAINDAGGVAGREIELEFCDTKGEVNKAGACAQKFAQDPDLLAEVGDSNYVGATQINPIFQQVGLPAIATFLTEQDSYDADNIFPVGAGIPAIGGGGFAVLAHAGMEKVMGVSLQAPGSLQFLEFAETTVLANYPEVEMLEPVLVPPGTADLVPFAASVIRANPDGIYVGLSNEATLIKALREQGFQGLIATPTSNITAEELTELGDAAENVVLVSDVARSGPARKQFEEELAEYSADEAAGVTDRGLNAWRGVHLFADVVEGIDGDVTRESITEALDSLSDYDTGGLTPNLDFSTPNPEPGFSRLFNPYVVGLTFADGEIRDSEPPLVLNLFTGEPAGS